jgi:hypothetical protein
MSRMPFLSRGKLYEVETSNPKTKSLIASYWGDAVKGLIGEGDTSGLDRYRGFTIGGHPFETDPDVIEDFVLSTDFDFQELYEP